MIDRIGLAELLARCRDDPCLFNAAILRRPPYWWRQVEVCRSVARYRTTCVVAGNAVGKDYVVGGIIPWWLLTRPRSLCVTTGPSQTLLGTVTWKELRRAVDGAPIPLGLEVTRAAKASPLLARLGEGWQAIGLASNSLERLSGQHEVDLLAIVEEASGVEEYAWSAIRSLNPSKLLVIGNPNAPETDYHRLARRGLAERADATIPDHKRAVTITIPATESPDIGLDRSPRGLADLGFLEEAERTYGRDSLWWLIHVGAKFPDQAFDQLIPNAWVDRCIAVAEPDRRDRPLTRRIAADLGEGTGAAHTVIGVGDELGLLVVEGSDRLDMAGTAQAIDQLMRRCGVKQEHVTYDAGGRGKDLARYLEQYRITEAVPYYGGGKGGPTHANRRSLCGWRLRQRLDPKRPLERPPEPPRPKSPFDPESAPAAVRLQPAYHVPLGPYWARLSEELVSLRYGLDGKKIALEPKDVMSRRLGRSPDYVDMLMMLVGSGP
ncbi:MAG TPA: hypothetical protein VG406_03705 [Isosphaeraceae bacterium]|nr:hypothetical protein [Isosphaeraceae bacterium]